MIVAHPGAVHAATQVPPGSVLLYMESAHWQHAGIIWGFCHVAFNATSTYHFSTMSYMSQRDNLGPKVATLQDTAEPWHLLQVFEV